MLWGLMNHTKELGSLSFIKCSISKGLKQIYSLREITLIAQKKEFCDREPKTEMIFLGLSFSSFSFLLLAGVGKLL